MSIWLRSLAIFSAIRSICFLGRSERRRTLCLLLKACRKKNQVASWKAQRIDHLQKQKYLSWAVPKRIENSWYWFICFSMKLRWLFTPQMIIWSASKTCICAPSLSFCMLFWWHTMDICQRSEIKESISNRQLHSVTCSLRGIMFFELTLNCSVIVLNRRE